MMIQYILGLEDDNSVYFETTDPPFSFPMHNKAIDPKP
jgi:hypothetical protein